MAGETQAADATVIPEEDNESDADFDAGFTAAASPGTPRPDAVSQDLPGAQTAQPEVQAAASTPEATPTTAPVQPTETPAAGPKKVEIDEAELEQLRRRAAQSDSASEQIAAMNSKFDKAFGQIGSLKQVVDKLRTETPVGEQVEISEADFKDLADAYPEIGKLTAQGLNKVLGKFKGTGGADPETIDKMVTERLQVARSEISAEVATTITDATLNGILPRWREKVKTPEFDTWMKAQPAEVQALGDSKDLGDAADMLRRFRRHMDRPAATPAPAPTVPKNNVRQRQIAAAVPVRGDGSASSKPASTDDDDFEAGFKAGKV